MSEDHSKYTEAMGFAALAEWADLPQEIQERLFERAVGEVGPEFRAELAKAEKDVGYGWKAYDREGSRAEEGSAI